MFRKKKDNIVEDVMLKKRIIDSVKLLATNPEVQLSLLPDFVDKPFEIATLLSDWLDAYNKHPYYKVNPQFTDSEFKLITELNDMFDDFHDSEEYEKSDWTEDAVMTSEKWAGVRERAKQVLKLLNIEYSVPSKSDV